MKILVIDVGTSGVRAAVVEPGRGVVRSHRRDVLPDSPALSAGIQSGDIIKSFDGKPVLEDISATFLPGEINMIIGRSGSGKTVLIKSIAGLFPVDEGEIYYGDTLFTSLDFRQKKAIRHQSTPALHQLSNRII